MEHAGLIIAGETSDAALAKLGSSRDGLSTLEAMRRQTSFGPNRIEAANRIPSYLLLAREFFHFFALILWVAATLAFFADYAEPGQGMLQLGFAIVAVIMINGGFSYWQAYRAEQALSALQQLLPQQIEVKRDGIIQTLPVQALVPGDLLILGEGTKVPCDCRIIESWGLRVNLAILSGESHARLLNAEPHHCHDPLSAENLLFAGALILSGNCTALVYATAMHTEFGRIAHLTQSAGDTESPLQNEIRRLSHLVAKLALLLGILFFGIGQALERPFWGNFIFAIGIIVANVPEGLLPTVTLALALAAQRMACRNALVRHLPAVETLGSATVILTDKTGTLTQNRMTVRELFFAGHHCLADERWPKADDVRLRSIARYCHTLVFHDGKPAGDPMEIALWQFGGDVQASGIRSSELPFDTQRKRISVIFSTEDGHGMLYCKGAPETVLPLCHTWLDNGQERPFDQMMQRRFNEAQEDLTRRGLRVLALADRPVLNYITPEENLTLCGLVGLEDPPRPDVHEAVTRCHEAGIRVIMITGDHPHTALALAREINMIRTEDAQVICGDELARLTPASLQLILERPEILFARVSAEQKMQVVQALQRQGEVVAVTGDGVNDAPALKTADIGVAMGLSGTDVAREAADIILLDDHFATIVNAIEEGRAVFSNIRKFLTYILTSNVPELVPYLAAVLLGIPLPLTIIQILAVDLGTDMLPALALGAEPPRADAMKRPPRKRGSHLLNGPLLIRAYLFLGPLEAAIALTMFFFILHSHGWHYSAPLSNNHLYRQATSACLAGIVLAQVANVLVCRDPLQPVWCFPLTQNHLLSAGIAFEFALLLAIIYSAPGQAIFGTAALDSATWLMATAMALLLLLLEEIRKAIVRHTLASKAGN